MNDDLRHFPATDPASPEPGGFSPDPGPAKTPVPPLTWGELKFVPLGLLALFGFPLPWKWMPFSFFSVGIIFFLSIAFWYASVGFLYSKVYKVKFDGIFYLFKNTKLLISVVVLSIFFYPLCLISFVLYNLTGVYDRIDGFFRYLITDNVIETCFLLLIVVFLRKFKILKINTSLTFSIIGLSSVVYDLLYFVIGYIYMFK